MHRHHRALVLFAATFTMAVLGTCGTAFAGAVTMAGTVVTYTGGAAAEALNVSQFSATHIEFDAGATPITESTPSCDTVLDGGGDGGANVECNAGITWTRVVATMGDGSDVVEMHAPTGGSDPVTVPTTITGGVGNDVLTGGTSDDTIDLGAGIGTAYGVAGNDLLTASPASGENPVLWGNAGNDTLSFEGGAPGSSGVAIAEGGNDTLRGGAGDTGLQGGIGDDTIIGGAGFEALSGDAGLDSLAGGAGDDTLSGGSTSAGLASTSDGADSMSGGAGSDTVTYAFRTSAVVVDLANVAGQGEAGENDTIADDVEHATGGNASDQLRGDAGQNILTGNAGADGIDGRGGFDQLRGGDDADVIVANSDVAPDLIDCGNDFTASASVVLPAGEDKDSASLDYVDVLDPGADCEAVGRAPAPALAPQLGTPDADVMVGTIAADLLLGLAGNDTLRGGLGHDELNGGTGSDKLLGGSGNDTIFGGAGNDSLAGELGNDELLGGPGSDRINGGAGADYLVGGTSADVLDGGLGKDFLVTHDGVRKDVATCTKVNLRTSLGRAQRDTVIADRGDVVRNAAYCARVVFA